MIIYGISSILIKILRGIRGGNKENDALSIRKQCEILSVNQSRIYYAPIGNQKKTRRSCAKIDEHYLDHPTEGVIRVRDFLFALGFVVNHKKDEEK